MAVAIEPRVTTAPVRAAARHMPALDGVRGVAILMVMFHHFTIISPVTGIERGLASAAAMGRYGVDLFFVLSGCLITGILIDSRSDPRYFRSFYTRRILRIFPLYYTLVFITFVIVPAASAALPPAAAATVRQYLEVGDWPWFVAFCSNFLIAIRDRYTNGLLDASWSLAIEEHFYLVWPALVFVLVRPARLWHTCVALIVAALVLRMWAWSAGWSRLQIYVVTLTRMDAVAFGALIAVSMRLPAAQWERCLEFARRWVAPTLAAVVALWLWGAMAYTATTMNTIGYTLVGLLGFQLVALAVPLERGGLVARFFNDSRLRFFGKYSYGLYMFQLPVKGALTILFFNQALASSAAPLAWQVLFYAVATVLTTAAALVSWHLLEKNILAMKDRVAPAFAAP